jgi:hypothetical protein
MHITYIFPLRAIFQEHKRFLNNVQKNGEEAAFKRFLRTKAETLVSY